MAVSCQPIDDDDVDVASERRRVLRGDADNDMLKIDNLTKVLSDAFKRVKGTKLICAFHFCHRCTGLARWAGSWPWTACVSGFGPASVSGCWE